MWLLPMHAAVHSEQRIETVIKYCSRTCTRRLCGSGISDELVTRGVVMTDWLSSWLEKGDKKYLRVSASSSESRAQ